MSSIANELPTDILLLIFQKVQNDYNCLYSCALVNRAFNQAASKFLYRRVVLSPRFRIILSLTNPIPTNSNLNSATLPRYAKYVEIIEITGYLPPQPPSNSTLSTTILNAITTFENLRVAILTPATCHEDVFTPSLQHFASLAPIHPHLRELEVNTSCTSEERAPTLVRIAGLSKLSIHSPTRAILELLPEWLRKLSDSLTELHLKDNCGSVTPGVLKSIIPLLERNIRSLSLGLSYSLADEDVFAFLRCLTKLESVELRYYWQLKPPKSRPNLPNLRTFTACYANRLQTRNEVRSLCKWIRRTISSSPIESLYIIQDDSSSSSPGDSDDDESMRNTGANVSFRSIIDHLCCRHTDTLRVLYMPTAYVGVKSLKKLLGCCTELEEVYLCAGSHALTVFKKCAPSLTKLHTASFDIRNIRLSRRRVVDMELVTAIMKHGPPLLRKFSVNGQTWESAWKRTKDNTFALTIHKQPKLTFPWDREPKSGHYQHHQHQPEGHQRQQVESALKSASGAILSTPSTPRALTPSGSRLRVRFSEPGLSKT
ncbi:hypothetical protein P691DRAFT_735742 [Macrolepiota fuliginosa MF-IS2]|uniref:F-box domain-containing protein n=1 Tax=Macrolepiota fuliginosa MF-IS2 TaxID=1400762 RepID=A0A9P5X503_9AGAR|nr:hypothetical protein P691DRAFT_735742 [Macrolepiota fuliginosa MF-IS2]